MAKIVTFGELLLRLSTANNQTIQQASTFDAYFGGAEANVAVALSQWGHQVKYITRAPKNEIAAAALSALRKNNVITDEIIFGGERLGVYFLQSGVGARKPEVIYDRSNSSMSTILPGMLDWKEILRDADIFHWSGITAAISASAANVCREAIDIASELGITISADLNYRSKLWNYGKHPSEVMPNLIEKCDIIFGGIDAPGHYFDIYPQGKNDTTGVLSEQDVASISNQMLSRFPKAKLFSFTLRHIINANHHKLQGIIYSRTSHVRSDLYDIPYLVDRVGGGDAFMAGLLHKLATNEDDITSLVNFAAAASVLKHYVPGDFPLSSEAQVNDFLKGNKEGISR